MVESRKISPTVRYETWGWNMPYMTDSDWTPQEREESFGVIVFQRSDKENILLVKTDHWGFPKGHPEAGEDGITAAIREVREETGIAVELSDAETRYVEEYEIRRERFTTKKTVTYFVGEGDGVPVAREGEVAETRWVPAREALELLTFESSRHILQSLV
jgi:8-oxo-dGTP pyrophosphatase MutT (NUDIX family)